MESVLISNRPKWCEKICCEIGKDKNSKPIYEKRIEVRKSKPSEVPFKCYIYCTKDRRNLLPIEHGKVLQKVNFWENTDAYYGFGKVIGEFICDKVDEYTFSHYEAEYRVTHVEQKAMCLNQPELIRYGKGKTLYGWHISKLKIYEKPKELSEFYRPCSYKGICYSCNRFRPNGTPNDKPNDFCDGAITRPPQSYMYVEEVE